ncbi:hypothetical protein [Streptomyces sp. NPDC054838]
MISFGATGVGLLHIVRPDLHIDGATLVLAAIAVVPRLGDLFESIELPGGTKLQYRRLEERVEAAEQRTDEVRQAVGDANRQARVALVTSGGEHVARDSAAAIVRRLVGEYTLLRRTEPSGTARTHRQEQIFAELVRATPYVADFDISAALGSADGGTRLTAYARLHAQPEASTQSARWSMNSAPPTYRWERSALCDYVSRACPRTVTAPRRSGRSSRNSNMRDAGHKTVSGVRSGRSTAPSATNTEPTSRSSWRHAPRVHVRIRSHLSGRAGQPAEPGPGGM